LNIDLREPVLVSVPKDHKTVVLADREEGQQRGSADEGDQNDQNASHHEKTARVLLATQQESGGGQGRQ
jgi:hypothetical protein